MSVNHSLHSLNQVITYQTVGLQFYPRIVSLRKESIAEISNLVGVIYLYS